MVLRRDLLILWPSVPSRLTAGDSSASGVGKTGRVGVDPAVALVEAAGDDPGLLEVRQLVLADGDEVGLAEQDVGGLVDRIGQQQS